MSDLPATTDTPTPAEVVEEEATPVDKPAPLVIQLALDPSMASALWRHPLLARPAGLPASQRPRSTLDECVWLDTAEGLLARKGRALEVPRKGARQYIHAMPASGFAVPGTVPLPIGELPPDEAPEDAEGEVLLPIAAFTGRRMEADAGEVHLTLRHGQLRCVAAEAPVARLELSGPPAAVLDLAVGLAEDLPLLPAASTLAETARALARQEHPRPRRLGAPDLGDVETIEAALALAIAHLADVLLVQAPRARLEIGPEGVHQSRVAARRLRSCLKQFRAVLDGRHLRSLDEQLGDFARALGDARDLDVFLLNLGADLAEATGPEEKRVVALLRTARQRRDVAYTHLRAMLDSAAFRRLIWTATRLATLRDWGAEQAIGPEAPLRPFARATLARRWRKMLKRGEGIENHEAESLHELRLDAKRVRYAAELFAPLWPGKATRRFLRRLSGLQEALGVANDTHVARALVAGLGGRGGAGPWAIGLAEGFALARGAGVREQAVDAWRELEDAEPFWED